MSKLSIFFFYEYWIPAFQMKNEKNRPLALMPDEILMHVDTLKIILYYSFSNFTLTLLLLFDADLMLISEVCHLV